MEGTVSPVLLSQNKAKPEKLNKSKHIPHPCLESSNYRAFSDEVTHMINTELSSLPRGYCTANSIENSG